MTAIPSTPTKRVTANGLHLHWYCDTCHALIPNREGAGWLILTGPEKAKAMDADSQWDEFDYEQRKKSEAEGRPGFIVYSLADAPRPEGGRWAVVCQRHAPDERLGDYAVGVERIATVTQMLRWTLHLTGKRWYEHTDWESICYLAAGS